MFSVKKLAIPAFYLFILIISACSSLKTVDTIENKNGVYYYRLIKGSDNGNIVVCGTVASYNDKQMLPAGIRDQHHLLTHTNAKGIFSISVTPGKYRFEARAIPFAICRTKSVKLSPGDTLKIDFLLKDYMGGFRD